MSSKSHISPSDQSSGRPLADSSAMKKDPSQLTRAHQPSLLELKHIEDLNTTKRGRLSLWLEKCLLAVQWEVVKE